MLSVDEIRELPAVEWTVDGVAQKAEHALIFGPPKSAKSLVALDLVLCVAAGIPWRGRAVRVGHVVYIALENRHALAARI